MDNYNEKDVRFYNALVNNWFRSTFERDKSLLWLSVIGLVSVLGLTITNTLTILGGMAVTSFSICILTILHIFNVNKVYLQAIIKEEDKTIHLGWLDKCASISFYIGSILTFGFIYLIN